MSASADRDRVQRAAMRVGALVAGASALVIAGGVGILIAVLVLTARREEHRDDFEHPPEFDGDRFVVDLDHVLPWVVMLGIVGVILLGAVAWLAARSSVRPLESALRMQRSFVSDASHELRTPLTALTSRIQVLERRYRRGDPVEETIGELRTDARVLDDVLTDMLLTAEGGSTVTGRAGVAECVAAAVQTMGPVAAESSVTLAASTAPDLLVRVAPVTLTRLCVALIDNAVQHAPSGTAVTITARRAGEVVEIRVTDRGSGVAPEDVERIFERFARGGEAGRRRGFGLGLALVREAASRSGGFVRVEQTSAEGTTFLLALPPG